MPAGYIANGDRRGDRGGQDQRGQDSQQVARRDNQNNAVAPTKESSLASSTDDEDLGSSSEDERQTRKMKGKEWLTAGLAAVATIHAAHGLHSSMEARDQRHLEVLKGEMSPEEARKKKNKARLQDAAAIAIAGLGIKGAYSEWQGVKESRAELEEMQKQRQERHEKRMRRRERMRQRERDMGLRGDDPDYRERRRRDSR